MDMQFIQTEVTGLYGNEVIKEMNEIINLYNIYEGPGQNWIGDEEDWDFFVPCCTGDCAVRLRKEDELKG